MESSESAAAERAIEETLGRWAAAIERGDLDTLVSLVTEDAEFWSHGAPPLTGRERVAAAFEPFFADYRIKQELDRIELIVTGEWAFLRGVEINHLTPRAGGDTVVQRQRAFSVLRRQPNGEWLFARGMTNLPPTEPTESGTDRGQG